MVLLARLQGAFQWGLVLVTDSESLEELPAWTDWSAQVTTARTGLLIRVLHEIDGEAVVEVLDAELPALGRPTVTTVLHVPSRVLRVGDALLGQHVTDVQVDRELVHLAVYLNLAEHNDLVTLVVT